MEKDATNQGVSDGAIEDLSEQERRDLEAEAREKTVSQKLMEREAIAQGFNKNRMEVDGFNLVEDTEGKPEDKDTKEAAELKEEQEIIESEAVDPEVTIVVDGLEQKVPLSKIKDAGIRTLQKESAADKRLEEAANLKRQAETIMEEAKRKSVSPPSAKEDGDEGTPEERDTDFAKKKADWVYAIQYGDESEATKAIDEIVKAARGTTSAINPEMIAQEVDRTLKAREEAAKAQKSEEIRSRFFSPKESGGFGDLTTNPYLMAEVTNIVDRKLKEGSRGDIWETYEAAGTEVRKNYENLQAKKKVIVDLSEERKGKKQQIDNVNPARSKEPSSQNADREVTEDEIRQQALSEIMKSRGYGTLR